MTTKFSFNQIDGNVISVKDYGAVGDGVTDDTAAIQAADTYANDNGKLLYLPAGDYTLTAGGTDYIEFKSSWVGDGIGKTKVTFKNIQWVNKTDVSISHVEFITDAASTGGAIDGYGGTNGFTVKSGNSGNIDFAAVIGLKFTNNKVSNTAGTTNCVKTEACDDMEFTHNHIVGGALSFYGNKQNRVDTGFSISTADTRANVVNLDCSHNLIDGNFDATFDLLNTWGGVGGSVSNNIITATNFDGMDLYTSGESMTVSDNKIYDVGQIGIQLKIDTAAGSDRDSVGAGNNRRIAVHNNIIENVYPRAATTNKDICGIQVLFSDDAGELTPTNAEFITEAIVHDNIILVVRDDSDYSPSDSRISGISLDAYNAIAHDNIVAGVRRRATSTSTNTGNAIAINSVGVGGVNNVQVHNNRLSAEINGIYVNGTTSAGTVQDIELLDNTIFQDSTRANDVLSNAGVFITPGVQKLTIDGGSIESTGSCIILRRDFDTIHIQNISRMESSSNALTVEGYGDKLRFINCDAVVTGKKVGLVTSTDSHWATKSNDWLFDSIRGDGDIDLTFANTAAGGIDSVRFIDNDMPSDGRIILWGFDNTSGNVITRVIANGNSFLEAVTTDCIDFARVSRILCTGNSCDAGANTVSLIKLVGSCDEASLLANHGWTAAGTLNDVTTATNVTQTDNVLV